jgi:cytidylate kinase
MTLPDIIAIDGPASSGKSTVGYLVAKRLDYLFFDTGIMYRAATLAALTRLGRVDQEQDVVKLAQNLDIDILPPSIADTRLADIILDGEDITWQVRTREVDANVSVVSAYKGVRDAMTSQQRRIGMKGRVVMVGRDIGTVVLPEARLKVYLDASVEERARRRYAELVARGEDVSYIKILEDMKKRDEYDSNRLIAPLKPAVDAVVLRTDGMSVEQVVDAIVFLSEAC